MLIAYFSVSRLQTIPATCGISFGHINSQETLSVFAMMKFCPLDVLVSQPHTMFDVVVNDEV